MASELETKLQMILNEKVDKIIPENIKKGITIFGVEGTYEGEEVEETEYIELEYIESTGEQYIDTGYQPNASTAMEFEVSKVSGPGDAPMFSASSIWSNNCFIFTSVSGYYNWWYYSGNSIQIGTISTDDTVDKIYIYRGYTKLNDVVVTSNTTVSSGFTVNKSLILFSGPVSGPDGQFTSYRLHSFKIMSSAPDEDPVYVRNFIPVQMKETGEIGLYDIANKVFYSNKGTGTFVAGPTK